MQKTIHRSRVCRSKINCDGAPVAEGRYVCKKCASELDRIKGLLTDDKERWEKGRAKKRAPVCCVPGCYEPRMPPDPHCDAHAQEAMVE